MKTRWFVVEVSDEHIDCPIVGNCDTKELAEDVVTSLTMQSERNFKIIGPITENMIQGRCNSEDVKIIEAVMEHFEYISRGGYIQ